MRKLPRLPAFTLMELLVVIAIIAILAAILFPVLGNMNMKSMEAKALSNLRQHGVAFNLFATERDGYLPSVMDNEINGKTVTTAFGWWIYAIKPYFDVEVDAQYGRMIHDPFYYKLIDEEIRWFRPGWGMNARMGLAAGDNVGAGNASSSLRTRYKTVRYPGNTVLLGPSFEQNFEPKNDGTLNDHNLSGQKKWPVPHTRRIGADSKGLGGTSALYLFLNGSVQNLTPEEAAEVLKLRPQ